MKKSNTLIPSFLAGLLFLSTGLHGQTGINTTTPDPNAELDVVSTTKGVLIPRLTGAQASTLAANTPAEGMLVYNTDQDCIQIFVSGSFQCLTTDLQADVTKDAWVDDPGNNMVKLGSKSNGTTTREPGTEFVAKDDGKIGIGTVNPSWLLDVQGTSAIGQFKRINETADNNAPGFLFSRARGTLTAQKNINPGDYLGKVQFKGRVAGSDQDFATFAYIASSNTTAGNGRFAFFKGSGSDEIMNMNTNTGNVGISTTTPQRKLHVVGGTQLSGQLYVGGSATTAGSPGTIDQVLTSNGDTLAPQWKSVGTISGTIADAKYIQGDTVKNIAHGNTRDVPGVTYTHTVPPGATQTLLFTVVGYAKRATTTVGSSTQGVFSLVQNTTKISSAYVTSVDGGELENVLIPATILKAVTLLAGTYTFKVQYSAWYGDVTVNNNPNSNTAPNASYTGATAADKESMLTKMQVLVYNN